jgi:hypothetical protein
MYILDIPTRSVGSGSASLRQRQSANLRRRSSPFSSTGAGPINAYLRGLYALFEPDILVWRGQVLAILTDLPLGLKLESMTRRARFFQVVDKDVESLRELGVAFWLGLPG